MLNWWESVLLGIVEGVTEFLPISSTGHLTVVEKLLGKPIEDPTVTAFTAVIQSGAMLAAIIYFWKDIIRIVTGWFAGLTRPDERNRPEYRMGWAVIAGTAVTGLIGFALHKAVEGPLRSMWVVAAGLVLWSVALVLGDRRERQEVSPRGEESVTWQDGLILGLVQCVSLIPGVSRSGATIVGGLYRGMDRVTATKLSFYLGIPTLLAAGGYELIKAAPLIGAPGGVGWMSTAIATAVSFVVAYAAIAWLLRFVQRNDFTAFVIYRVLLAVVIVALLLTHTISAA